MQDLANTSTLSNTIGAARLQATGSNVTVKGIVTNGSELGKYPLSSGRFLAGIAAYGTSLANVKLGDSILVSGTLTNYNQLLEISPVTSVTVINSNNAVPIPKEITIGQISSSYQGQLIKITNATFKSGGATIAKSSYTFQVGTDTSVVYASSTSVIGQVLPSGLCSITGILSQFNATDATKGFQILPRTMQDLAVTQVIQSATIAQARLQSVGKRNHC